MGGAILNRDVENYPWLVPVVIVRKSNFTSKMGAFPVSAAFVGFGIKRGRENI